MARLLQFALILVLMAANSKYPSKLRGDYIFYTLPGTNQTVLLRGKTKVLTRQLLEYTHPQFGTVILNSDNTLIIPLENTEEYKNVRLAADQFKQVDDYVRAAKYALRCGMLNDCYDCLSRAFQIDADHPSLQIPILTRQRIQASPSDDALDRAKIRDATGLDRFQTASSQHYVLLYDANSSGNDRASSAAANRKLQLLENVFETFYMSFALNGVSLKMPESRLMAVLFASEQTYQRYSVNIDPRLMYAGGYWSSKNNVIVFYDQGTTPAMKRMQSTLDDLKKQKQLSRGTAMAQRAGQLKNVYEMLTKIAKEQSDIEVVTHEAAHQLAANSGLLPLDRIGVRWVHEGMASYCETPSGAVWGGIGGINSTRLLDYRNVARDPNRHGLKNIVSDRIVFDAKTQLQAVEAYGPAWALTHFLMTTQFDQLMKFYHATNSLPVEATAEAKIELFQENFGDIDRLQSELDRYVSGLKTDLETIQTYQAK